MSSVTAKHNRYAEIFKHYKVLYFPTCLLLQKVTKCYSEMSMLIMSGHSYNLVDDMLDLLRYLTPNFREIAKAYRDSRILYFLGDWKNDKLQCRKMLHSIMSRLGYICELTSAAERRRIYLAIKDMAAAWTDVEKVLGGDSRTRSFPHDRYTNKHFRCENPSTWRQAMAKSILLLDATNVYNNPDTCLILFCYKRIRNAFVQEIERMERKQFCRTTFDPEKLQCVHNDDIPIACANCTQMTDCFGHGEGTRKIIRTSIRKQIHREREGNKLLTAEDLGPLGVPESLEVMNDE